MLTRRLLLVGAVVAALVSSGIPASAKGRTVFVVSGGDLKHPVTFDSAHMRSITESWRPESHVPLLTGWQYRVRSYDADTPAAVSEWIYVPDASGAIPVGMVGTSRSRVAWLAFSPAFNEEFIRVMRAAEEGRSMMVLVAIGIAILLMMTAAGGQRYAIPRWIARWLMRDRYARVSADPGPSFLYTSVPRRLWPVMGHLGRAPASLPSSGVERGAA